MVQIEIVLSGQPYVEAYRVWDAVVSNHIHNLAKEKVIDGFSGTELDFLSVSEHLFQKKADGFFIELQKGSISYSYIADLDFSRLDIKNIASSKVSAVEWVSSVIDEPSFSQARLYDKDYDRWQNMEEVSYYEAEKKDHSFLPKKSNGLPFPLEREIIDIADNPGRWALRRGYIESIGSTMWASKALLAKLETDPLMVKSNNKFHISDLGRVVRFDAQAECFKDAAGMEAGIQDNLRRALFKK